MVVFTPVAADQKVPQRQCLVPVSGWPFFPQRPPPTKLIEMWVSQVVATAAVMATGCDSVSQLDRLMEARVPAALERDQERFWARLSRGDPRIRPALKRCDERAVRQIAALGNARPAVESVLTWPLWRLLDPEPLTLWDIGQLEAVTPTPGEGGLWRSCASPATSAKRQCELVARAMRGRTSQVAAVHAHWFGLRRSVAIGDLEGYRVLIAAWFDVVKPLLSDRLFTCIADEVDSHTMFWFASVQLSSPPAAASRSRLRRSGSAAARVPAGGLAGADSPFRGGRAANSASPARAS